MMTQDLSPKHKMAVLLAFVFAASVIFSIANLMPSFFIQTSTVELTDDGYPLGKMDRRKIATLAPTVMILPQFDWSPRSAGLNEPSTTIVPVLAIKDASFKSRICDLGPNMMTDIRQALDRSILQVDMLTPDRLGEAGHTAAQKVNERFGKVWVKNMYFLTDVTTPVQVAAKGCNIIL